MEYCATIVNFFIGVVIGLCLEYHLLDIGPCSMMNTLNHFYAHWPSTAPAVWNMDLVYLLGLSLEGRRTKKKWQIFRKR